jgi:hypothetical protein
MTCDPILKKTHSKRGFETNEAISWFPVTWGTTNIESNTTLKDIPEVETGIGEELLYWKSNFETEEVQNGAVKVEKV